MRCRYQFWFNFAFKFNLRRYTEDAMRRISAALGTGFPAGAYTRPRFSST
jgi:hypothetical protein